MTADTPPNQPADAIVEMSRVTLHASRQPGRVRLEEVDWRVNPGEFWVVGGLLDSGKSDFLLLTAGLIPPAKGTSRLFGCPLTPEQTILPAAQRRRIGVVFGHGQLQTPLTLAENVALPLRYHQDCSLEACADWVGQLLEFTETDSLAGRDPAGLSLAWRLRAGLARALVLKPELLLLDNPVSGLDPRQLEWWRSRLQALAEGHELLDKRPLTLVLAVADLRPWRDAGSQFAILKNQRLMHGSLSPDREAALDQLQGQLLAADVEPA